MQLREQLSESQLVDLVESIGEAEWGGNDEFLVRWSLFLGFKVLDGGESIVGLAESLGTQCCERLIAAAIAYDARNPDRPEWVSYERLVKDVLLRH